MRFVQRIDATIQWEAGFDPASGRWVAKCDALRLTANGETWAELESAIAETQNLLFADLLEDGELEQFLARHGWRPSSPLPSDIPAAEIAFDIPTTVTHAAHAPN